MRKLLIKCFEVLNKYFLERTKSLLDSNINDYHRVKYIDK